MAPRRQLDRVRVHLPQAALPSQQYLPLLLNLHHNRDRLREVTFAYFIIPPFRSISLGVWWDKGQWMSSSGLILQKMHWSTAGLLLSNSETCSKSKIPLIVIWCFSSDDLLPLIKNSFGIYYVFLANNNSFQKGTHIFISQCAKFVKVFLVRLTLQRYLFLSYTQYMFPFVKAHIPNPKVCFHMQKYLQSHLFQFTSTYFHFHKYLFFFAKVFVPWFDFHLLILCGRTWLNPFQLSHCLGVVAEDPIQKVK